MKYLLRNVLLMVCIGFSVLDAAERGSSAPYISGDTFRVSCDFTFDELSKNIDPSLVKNGNTIFVKTDFLEEFFTRVHPNIPSKYILVSHNSDCHVPGRFAPFLEDEKIIAWFGQNLENCLHSKMHPIPIGIANRCWDHGNIDIVTRMRKKISEFDRTIFLYMNFQIATYPGERGRVANMFRNEAYCVVSDVKDYATFLADLSQSIFVLSPRGNGSDCHRTWECLLMGAIPIVKKSSLDPLYENLPVLIVDDWSDVTYEFLLEKYQEMQANSSYEMERAYSEYWLKLIESFKRQYQ